MPALPASLARLAAGVAFLLVFAASARAQEQGQGQGQPQHHHHRALESAHATLDQIEAALARESIDHPALAGLAEQVMPVHEAVAGVVQTLAPQIQAIDSRLAQLGRPPGPGDPPESPEVSQERAEQARIRGPMDDLVRRARLMLVRAEQVWSRVLQRQRDLFAGRLLAHSRSILDPALWIEAASETPRELAALGFLLSDWGRGAAAQMTERHAALLGLVGVLALLIAGPVRSRLDRLGRRFATEQAPATRLRRSANAVWVVLVTTVAPAMAALVLYYGLVAAASPPPRLVPLLWDAVRAVAFLAFVDGLSRAILAPGLASWRLADLPDAVVDRIGRHPLLIAAVFTLGALVRRLNDTLGAGLSVTILANGVVALASAFTVALALGALRSPEPPRQIEAAPEEERRGGVLALARTLAWTAVAAVVVAAALGYVALALFLANQVIWLALIGAILYVLLAFVDDLFTLGLAGTSPFGRTARHTIGLRSSSVEQIGVLLSGLIRVALILVAALFALAPWGIGSGDVIGWLRGGLSGFELGALTVSPGAILGALAILIGGVLATRAIQRWLEKSYLPRTRIDDGLKNSIRTGLGYLGVFVAAALALSALGLGLDKIAIVAGALSVGIGFGLQSIVNNFVSGLILLAERPIKVGDLIAIAGDLGNVKRISVRSTEIELFDRSTLIVPNSELISRQVRNLTHQSAIARLRIEIGVGAGSDPEAVRELLLDCARKHPVVLAQPEPQAFLMSFGDQTLNFQLFAFLPSARQDFAVGSELRIAILRALREAKVEIPFPQRDLNIKGVEKMEEALHALIDTARPRGEAEDRPLPRRPKALP